jgi:hypothetical protein
MNNSLELNTMFVQCIDSAVESLRQKELSQAYDSIIKAICMKPDAPEPHNLLGIWYELQSDGEKARRHYRAAYSLDPTYKPPCKNLERISALFDHSKPYAIDFGDEPEEEMCVSKNNRKHNAS